MSRTTSLFAAAACILIAGGCSNPPLVVDAATIEEVDAAKAKTWEAIDVGPFGDSIHHARMKYVDEKAPYAQYEPEQIVHIAENLLAWQNADGGWPKNVDWLRVLAADEMSALPWGKAGRSGQKSSLDNRSTWPQIDYLARVYGRTSLWRYGDAALKGLDYVLVAQHASGGWRGADVNAITFNDDVVTGVMGLLQSVLRDEHFYYVDAQRRPKVEEAYRRGIDCILKCQVRVGDRLTAWGQQHSHDTYESIWARSFEPPCITPCESVGIVRFLMSIDDPSPEVIASVQAAVAWFDKVKIRGLRVDKVAAEPTHFPYHFADFDCIEVEDPSAPPIWTRMYHVETEQPIFCTRKKKITTDYEEVGRERRTGYGWYGYWPAGLLENEYPEWQRKWAPGRNVLEQSDK